MRKIKLCKDKKIIGDYMFKLKDRAAYIIVTVLLLAVEVCIALFVNDAFIRPYVGDVLVVIVIYTFIRIFIPKGHKLLPLWVFIFATAVEALQYFNIVQLLGLQDNTFMKTLIGSVFDFGDIICYAVGCALLVIFELIMSTREKIQNDVKEH